MSYGSGWVSRVRVGFNIQTERIVASACTLSALVAGGLAGCSGHISGEGDQVGVAASALTWNDGSTVITVNADVEDPRCEDGNGLMGITGTFTASSTVTVAMLVSVDGVLRQQLTVATPADFSPSGSNFVASFGADANVPAGVHRIDTCFALVTARGVSLVRACLPSVNTDQDCSIVPPPVDTTPPSIVGSAAPAPNSAGWNNSDVTVSFTCSDADSGIASCTEPVVLSMEGENLSAVGTAVDNAGNMASTTVADIRIDMTAPSISATRSVEPSEGGWNNTPVTVSFECADALSGVASCSASETLASEGVGMAVSGMAVDNAGNTASVSEGPINIDMTPPVIVLQGGGSYAVDAMVSVTCSASDDLSGIASTTCANLSGPAYTFGGGTVSVSASATDHAGNMASASTSFAVEVTASGVCMLAKNFASHPSQAKAACSLVQAAEQDLMRGRTLSARIKLLAFSALVGVLGHLRVYSSEEVTILRRLAGAMLD